MSETNISSAEKAPDHLGDIVLRAKGQSENTRYLAELREELKQKQLTNEELEELARRFETSNVEEATKNSARTIILEQMKEKRQTLAASLDPRTWSPETQQTARFAAAGVLGTGLVLWLGSKLFKASEGVRKTGRWIRNAILGAVGVTAIAAGALMGYTAWQNWGELQKQMSAMSGAIQKQIDAMRGVVDQAKDATGEAKEALEKQAKEMQKKIDQMIAEQKAAREKKVTEQEEDEKMEEQNEDEKMVEPEESEDEARSLREKAIQEAERALERSALELTAKGLLMMHSPLAKKADIKQESEENAVAVILNNPEVQKLTVKQLRTIHNPEEAAKMLPANATDAEKKALVFLALVIGKLEPQLHESVKIGYEDSFDDVSLKDCIDQIHHVPKLFVRLQGALKGKSWKDIQNVPAIIGEAFGKDSFGDIQNDPSMRQRLQTLGLAGHEPAFFAECMAHGRSNLLKDIHEAENEGEPKKAINHALVLIREDLLSDDTKKYIMLYLHGRTDHPYEKKLTEQLTNNLTVFDAVQLYMYVHLARRENDDPELESAHPIGALLMQMKTLDLLGKVDADLATRMKADLVSDLTKADATLQLPDGTKEVLLEVFGTVGTAAVDFGQDKIQKALNDLTIWASEFYKDYPRTIATTGGVAAVAAAPFGASWLNYILRRGTMGRLTDDLVTTTWKTHRHIQHYALPSGWKAYDITNSRRLGLDISKAEEAIENIADLDLRKVLHEEFVTIFNRKPNNATFNAFYNRLADLKTTHPPGVIDGIEQMVRTEIEPFKRTLNIRRRAFLWERSARWAGLAAQGYTAYEDWQGVLEASKQESAMRTHTTEVLHDIQKQLSPSNGFVQKPGQPNVYLHTKSGVEINLKEVTKQLKEGDAGLESKTLAQELRTGISVGSGLAMLLMGAKSFTGPAGVALCAVEVTVRAGIGAWEEGKMREFMNDAPPWLLVILGTEQTTGKTEADWLNKSSSWMTSDLLQGSADKAENRKKMLFAILCHDLQTSAPELFDDITQGLDAPPLLDNLYNRDFRQFILPAFYVNLYNLADSNSVSWNQISQGDVHRSTDSWNPVNLVESMIIPNDVTLVQIRTAMRSASILYSQHLHEKQYIGALDEQKKGTASTSTSVVNPLLEDAILSMGEESVLGTTLSTLSEETIAQNEGKTRAELLLTQMMENLRLTQGDSKAQKLSHNANLFSVQKEKIAGLPQDFQFNGSFIADMVQDPVLRQKLSQVFAETTDEAEGSVRPSWKEWQKASAWKTWLEIPNGSDPNTNTHLTRMAANGMRKAAGQQLVLENASVQAAEQAITMAGIEFFGKARTKSTPIEDRTLSRTLYGNSSSQPIVYTKLGGRNERSMERQKELCRMLRIPNTDQPEFGMENIVAVFFEGVTIADSGHDAVLATFVFKDPNDSSDNPPLRIVQQAATSAATATIQSINSGMAHAENPNEFLKQNQGTVLLEQSIQALRTKRERSEAAQQESTERQERQADAWDQSKPERDAKENAQNTLRQQALEQAKIPGRIVYIPGKYTRDEATKRLYLNEGLYQGTINGKLVAFTIPPYPATPSMSAVSQTRGIRKPATGERPVFTASADGTSHTYNIDVDSLIQKPSENFTLDDQRLSREVLTTPLDIKGHPKENDPAFIKHVRTYELSRLLNCASYKSSWTWYAEEFRSHLFQELLPYYENATNKKMFLNTLMNNLLTEQVVESNSYDRILKNMQKQY